MMVATQDNNLATEILRRHDTLERMREPFESRWQEVCEFVAWRRDPVKPPKRSSDPIKPSRRGVRAFNSTAVRALQVWADGMRGYLVSPTLRWFRLVMADRRLNEHPDIKAWLEEVEDALYSVFAHSNFYEAMAEYFYDAGSIGTATMFIEEDVARGEVLFTIQSPWSVCIAEDARGRVDTIYRDVRLTARQAVGLFGADDLDARIVQAAEQRPDQTFQFVHAVYPNAKGQPGYVPGLGKPWASVWVCTTGREVVRRSGYYDMPATVWRCRKEVPFVYGFSPAMDAMCDVLGLNQISKDLLHASHVSVNPPYNVPQEQRGKVSVKPRGINYYHDPRRKIEPVITGVNYPVGVDREERMEKAIQEHFRVDFFMMMSMMERQMTATEVLERQGEKAVVLGSQIGRLNADCLDPLIDRVFAIEYRAGRLPDPPALIAERGGEVDVDYVGPLAQVQRRLLQTQGINQGLEALEPLIRIYPEARHVIDPVKAARRVAEAAGIPQDMLRDEDAVAQLIQAEQQQAQLAQAAQMAQQGAQAARNINEPVAEGSPLEMLMQGV